MGYTRDTKTHEWPIKRENLNKIEKKNIDSSDALVANIKPTLRMCIDASHELLPKDNYLIILTKENLTPIPELGTKKYKWNWLKISSINYLSLLNKSRKVPRANRTIAQLVAYRNNSYHFPGIWKELKSQQCISLYLIHSLLATNWN